MGAEYTRQSSTEIADGNTIQANDFNAEFQQLLAAFSTTGHTHDGTLGEGGPITKIGPAQNITVSGVAVTPSSDDTISIGGAGAEFKDLHIDGKAYIDELGENLLVGDAASVSINFWDTDIAITSSADGQLDIDADSEVEITVSDAEGVIDLNVDVVDISNDIKMSSDAAVLNMGADDDIKITHVADTGVLVTAGSEGTSPVEIQLRDSTLTIGSSTDGQLDIEADAEVAITVSDAEGIVDINVSEVRVSNDLKLDSDAAVLSFGADDDVSITHVADTGLLLNDASEIQFRDSALTVGSTTDGQLDIDADTTLNITTPTVELDTDSQAIKLGVDGEVEINHVADTGLEFKVTNATTAGVTDILDLQAETTGSAAAGIGTGLTFSVETGATNFETTGAIRSVTTDVTAAEEDADLAFYTMQGGSLTEAFRYDGIDDNLVVSGGLTVSGAIDFGGALSLDSLTAKTTNGDLTLSGNGTGKTVISGDLQVDGTTTTVNSTTVTIDDPIFTLGGDTAPASDDDKDRGIEFRYYSGSAKLGFFGYDDSASEFTFLTDATNSSEVFSGTVGNIRTNTTKADVLDLLDDDGDASIKLQAPSSVTTTTTFTLPDGDGNAGEVLQTDGSGNLSFAVSLPTGSLLPYAGSSAPSGYLLCYGQEVSRTTYADLFTAISTTYGAGDDSTTFNLPDLRGRVIAGKDDMGGTSADRLTDQSGGLDGDVLGDTGGAETHTLAITEMAEHSHYPNITGGYNNDPTSRDGLSKAGTAFSDSGANAGPMTEEDGTDVTGGQAHNNVQPTIILNYIIKT